jgi:energy-coupling factor transporter ATPase
VGANGSGKTTLARHLNALHLPDEGQVRIQGLDTRDPHNHPAIRSNVGMVFQSPEDQIVSAVLEEDIAFGPENLGLPPAEIRTRVEEALEITGLTGQRNRPPHLLSAGQLQRAALAGVLAMRPRCVIFDETTAMLDPGGRRMVRGLIQRLHEDGLTVLVISHFMREAVEAERVIVLDHGRIALDSAPEQVFRHPADLQKLGLDIPYTARLASQLHEVLPGLPANILRTAELIAALPEFVPGGRLSPVTSFLPTPASSGNMLIDVQALEHVYLRDTPLAHPALTGASLQAAEGSIHGLIGVTGSGKSTLLQHLNGLLLPQAGTVKVGPFDLNDDQTDLKAVRRYAALVFQNPEFQLFEQYVGDEIAYAPRLQGEQGPVLRETVRSAMEMVGLDFEAFKDRFTFTLSGGERRKVALASMLAMHPQTLLLDEPTAGLDPLSRRETLRSLKELHSQGITQVLSSHYMEDVAELCDAVTVIHAGQTLLAGPGAEVFGQVERLESVGLDVPLVAYVAATLRGQGWPLPANIIRPEDLVALLGRIQESARG